MSGQLQIDALDQIPYLGLNLPVGVNNIIIITLFHDFSEAFDFVYCWLARISSQPIKTCLQCSQSDDDHTMQDYEITHIAQHNARKLEKSTSIVFVCGNHACKLELHVQT